MLWPVPWPTLRRWLSAVFTVCTIMCAAAAGIASGSFFTYRTESGVLAPQHENEVRERSVVDLVDPSTEDADVRVRLVARTAVARISNDQSIDAWTWNGTAPGPDIVSYQGDLVEVSVRNDDIEDGVTVHWHGVDLPNAMDGVAGVTQEAILPGQEFTYRFRSEQAGTFWYHTHQNSAVGVGRGLFGAFIVLPVETRAAGLNAGVSKGLDMALTAHTWRVKGRANVTTIGMNAETASRLVDPGTLVRLRLINTDSLPQHWVVSGAEFVVAAIDGTDVHKPSPLRSATLTLGGGGRYDLVFTMPETPVAVGLLDGNKPQQLLTPNSSAGASKPLGGTALKGGVEFDPLRYGTPSPVPFTMDSDYDVEAVQKLETHRTFIRGVPTTWWTINGKRAPDIPMIMVDEGDTVRVHIINASDTIHPMHLHGHHVLVLERNGAAPTGSPWWADTVNLNPGDDVWVAFTANNPGIWMDHCHNLDHQAAGMLMHVGYRGVSTPFSHH